MKQIRLLTVASTDPNLPDDTLEYAEMIRQVVRRPLDPSKGADFEEIRKGIRIFDKLDEVIGDVLVLEDSDWEYVRDKTKAMPWGVVDRRIYDFVEAITEAPEVSKNGTA